MVYKLLLDDTNFTRCLARDLCKFLKVEEAVVRTNHKTICFWICSLLKRCLTALCKQEFYSSLAKDRWLSFLQENADMVVELSLFQAVIVFK